MRLGLGTGLTRSGRRGAPPLLVDTFTGANGAALDSGVWTVRCGTWEINTNRARAKTVALDGVNIVTNGEFTTDTTGWQVQSGATLTRRDFTTSPDIDPTGGADEFGLEVAHGTAALGHGRYDFSAVPGVDYTASLRGYSPSANTVVNGAMVFLSAGGASSLGASAEDTWQTLSCSLVASSTAGNVRAYCQGTTLGDKAYFDAVSVQAKTAVVTCNPGTANADMAARIVMPASGVKPFGVIARYQDATHYWKWRIRPGTAGIDFELLSVNGDVTTVVASADVDWVAGQEYVIQLSHHGTHFLALVNGTRVLRWSSSYLQSATLFGLYDAGVANAAFESVSIAASYDMGVRGVGFVGDSIDTGPDEWPQKVIAARPDYVEFNHSGNGENIRSFMVVQVAEMTNEALDIIFNKLGTNDTGTIAPLEAVYLTNVQTEQTDHPGARIICINVLPKTTAGTRSQVNAIIASAAATAGVEHWDTDVSLVNPGQAWIIPATDTSDGLHPNDAGSVKIAAEVVARL